MKADYKELALLTQVLERQKTHSVAMGAYLQNNCSLSPGEFGLLLMALQPANELVVTLGSKAMNLIGDISQWAADTSTASLNAYVESEISAHESFAGLTELLGGSAGAFPDPRQHPPTLGPAANGAPSDYGEQDSWVWQKAGTAVTGSGELVGSTFTRSFDHAQGWFQPGTGVSEKSNPESYLVAPTLGENFVEDLRWTAGPILGGLDWLAEQLLGYSILQECVLKPFGGDWQAINKSSAAWKNNGQALTALGTNFSALPGQSYSWTGEAADQFKIAMSLISTAVLGLSFACDFVSGLVAKVGLVAKLACTGIARGLRWISEELVIIAAQAAVPVVGWVIGAVDIIRKVWRIVGIVRTIYALIDAIMDAINDFIESRAHIMDAVFAIENLAEYGVRRAVTAR